MMLRKGSASDREAASGEDRDVLSDARRAAAPEADGGSTASGTRDAPVRCIHEWFEQRVRKSGAAIAVCSEAGDYRYDDLNRLANRLAHFILARRLPPESVIALRVDRGPMAVVCQLAVLKAGCAYVVLGKDMPRSRMEHVLGDVDVSMILVDAGGDAPQPGASMCVDLHVAMAASADDRNPNLSIQGDRLAHIIFTSGSTGTPKCVARTHRSIVNHVAWLLAQFPYVDEHTVLHMTSFSFVRGVWELYTPLVAGVRVAISTLERHKDMRSVLAQIARYGASRIASSPSLMPALLGAGVGQEAVLQGIRYWYVSGERLNPDVVEQARMLLPNTTICNIYGATEVGPSTALAIVPGRLLATIPIGTAASETTVYVLRGDFERAKPMEVGEIAVGGANLPRAYLNRVDLTAATLVPDPISGQSGRRLYLTGDLGFYNRDGEIEMVGRNDHQVKIRGYRVEIEEIEQALRRHAEVAAVAVTARPDGLHNLGLTAHVVFRGQSTGWHVLRTFLLQSLPHYMVPTAWHAQDALPLTSNGKLDRVAIAALGTRAVAEAKDAEDDLTRMVQDLWHRLLGTRPAPHDDFLSIGGNSLLATQVVTHLARHLQINLPVLSLFLFPTLGEFSEHLRNMLWFLPDVDPKASTLKWETLSS